MSFLGQQGSVRCHGHHIGVSFHSRQVKRFRQSGLHIVGAARQMGGIFTQINLRFLTVITVIIILIMYEPAGGYIIVLIHHRQLQLRSQFPSLVVICPFVERAYRSDHRHFRIFLFHSIVNHSETLLKHRCYQILVSNADKLQVERFGMSCLRTFFAPLRPAGITIGILYQV